MKTTELATFAGGCFWCMEPAFDKLEGVISTTVGYSGGSLENPTYEAVSSGATGHAEVVQIEFDPEVVTYEKLLDVFWRNIDPTVKDRQFCDVGTQYRTAVFYHSDEQRKKAEDSKARLKSLGKFPSGVMTEISPAGDFYRAEDYHQDYYRKNPIHYNMYKLSCGREDKLNQLWGGR